MWFLKNLCLAFRSWHLTHVTLSEWHPESTKVLLSEPSHHEKLQTGRMECHHLHIMWLLDVGFQSDTSTKDGKNSCGKGDGRWLFCWKEHIFGILEVRLVNMNDSRSRTYCIQTGTHTTWPIFRPRSGIYDEKLLAAASTEVQLSCCFFLRWQLSFLRMLGVVEKNGQKFGYLIELLNASMKLNGIFFHQNPRFLQQSIFQQPNAKIKVCPKSGWQFSDFRPCHFFLWFSMNSMGLVYLPKKYCTIIKT